MSSSPACSANLTAKPGSVVRRPRADAGNRPPGIRSPPPSARTNPNPNPTPVVQRSDRAARMRRFASTAAESAAVLGVRPAPDPQRLHLLVEVAALQVEEPRRLGHVVAGVGKRMEDDLPLRVFHLISKRSIGGDAESARAGA